MNKTLWTFILFLCSGAGMASPVADGLSYQNIQSLGLNVHVLEVDLTRIRIQPALGADQIIGQETASSMARRYGALAAINGGNSVSNDAWNLHHGDPNGFYALNGKILSEPFQDSANSSFTGRGSIAISSGNTTSGDKPQEIFLDRPWLRSWAMVAGRKVNLQGINRQRLENEVIIYTPEFNRTTLTDSGGFEIVVENNRIQSFGSFASSPIPPNGFVLSFGPTAGFDPAGLSTGQNCTTEHQLRSMLEEKKELPIAGFHYVSAGPILMKDSKPMSYIQEESRTSKKYSTGKEPRTIIAKTADRNRLSVFVFEGDEGTDNEGATLNEAVAFIKAYNPKTTDIYNLDGGDSSVMVVNQKVVSKISHWQNEWPTGKKRYIERRRADAILFLPKDR